MSVPDVLPPSPPTTNHRHRSSMPLPFKPAMTTPDESPGSFPPSSGTGTRKRVEFSPWPNVVDPLSSTPASDLNALKALPPSRDCQKHGRSILKPYIEPVVSISSLDGTDERLVASPETLEVIAQQLINNNKGSSLDAYQTLSQIIKAYDEIPEDVNTRGSIAAILRCIKRDLSVPDQVSSSPIDTQLMTQALKVSVILVWSEHLSPLLTDEFRVFIIDRSINALIEHTAPKVIIIHYMHLLAMQNFRSSILATNNRAIKLLEALREITDHVQGKGAMAERLLIYQRMIEQARPIMKSRASLWIKEVFLGLSSSVKEIRDKAMSVSTRACAAFPSASTVASAAREALASTIADKTGNDRTLSTLMTQRLEKMVAAKDEATQVPQIWALAMLLCNSTDTRLESWTLLREWLKVIQRCFNCSDTSVRSQAFPAWNRFIYISKPHDASEMLASMLAKPIMSQLERTSSNTNGKGLRPAAVSSYCMLLHYAFRPAATHKQYTKMWNEYIVKIMGSQFLSKSTANADLCSRVIMALMWKEHSASRIWNENRAHENTLLDPEELPAADCKWIRSKTEAILQIFRLLFKHSVWGPSVQHSDQAFVAKAWRHFLRAVRESVSKEILPSIETKRAIQHIAHFVRDVSETAGSFSNTEGRAQLVSNIAVTELGPGYFLEALEADVDLRSSAILGELLQVALSSTTAAQSKLAPYKTSSSGTKLPSHVQRCIQMLDQSLRKAYDNHDHNTSNLKSSITITSKAIKIASLEIVLPIFKILQSTLSAVLEDSRNLAKLGSDTPSLHLSWLELSEAVADKLSKLRTADYEELDELLAAMLSSCNMFTQNSLLKAWASTTWQETYASYGPKLLEAVNRLQSHAEINLPGVHTISEEADTQIERIMQFVPTTAMDPEQGAVEPLKIAEPTGETIERMHEGSSIKQADAEKQENAAHSRPHHDDSQVDFVPVNGEAKFVDDTESQYLTERQKEVHERQRIEQAVTFPDLRSSPRPRSTRSSRAPSADCEMARKFAAVDALPSTPTIIRHSEAMDEDEAPTPTPKAKNKSIGLIEVDILSSPPSILVNKKSDITGLDLLSSPPKASHDIEVDMIDLDNIVLTTSEVTGEEAVVGYPFPTTATFAIEQLDDEGVPDMLKTAAELIFDSTTAVAGLESTVQETVQEAGPKSNEGGPKARLREASPAADSEHNSTSDEIDDLSASQLSQSLEFHIAEEAKQSFASPDSSHVESFTQKQRKRPTSGYADQDRKKRRRRATGRSETSMSSLASDESHIEDKDIHMDYVVVDTTPLVPATGRRTLAKETTTTDEINYDSPSTSASKRRRPKLKKADRIPLQVRTRSFRASQERLASSMPTDSVLESPTAACEQLGQSSAVIETPISDANVAKMVEEVAITSNPQPASAEMADEVAEEQHDSSKGQSVMTALQLALKRLESMDQDQPGSIDLRLIDDLCFKIRFKAQEIGQRRI